ncbi:MAG: DUF2589 domain-containing protein [Deltaproteobacteria bacterium]|nr:MAG: DUF2589 domain-containing protein [Deltaproteobacteria bacterium]
MANKLQQFDQLIIALAKAVVEAQNISKRAQLNYLKSFFYKREPTEIEAEAEEVSEAAKKAARKAKEVKEKAEKERLKAEAELKNAEAERLKAETGIEHYSPKTVNISFQSLRPSAKLGDMDTVRVPLITLVKPIQHSIEEMIVSMNVELGEIRETERKEGERKKVFEQKDGWGGYEGETTINVSTTSGKQGEAVGTAHVTIKIKAEEPQEGLARLIDSLYKVL